MEWQLVGRQTELDDLRRAVDREAGAVVVGPAGVGKTRLVAEVVDRTSPDVNWVAATSDAAAIPYGPLVAALPGAGRSLIDGSGDVSMVRRCLEDCSVLVIDDAHLLDPASASLVHHLAIEGVTSVLATIRLGEPISEPVTALWKDEGLQRLDLSPLSRDAADELVEVMLAGRADPHLLDTLWGLSRGGPLEIRELILSAHELGALECVEDVWILRGDLIPTQRVSDLIEARLHRLTRDERQVAELLAYSEAIELSLLLDVADREALGRLERSRIAVSQKVGGVTSSVELAHPLYGEVLRSSLPAGRRRHLAKTLADQAVSSAIEVDPLRLAMWRHEAGIATGEELATAGRTAFGRMAYPMALQLGQASLEATESYRAHTVVAAALAEEGELREAERHFHRAYEMAPNPLYAEWALFGLAWYLYSERPDDAIDMVRKELAKETDSEIQGDLRAGLATLLMFQGEYAKVSELTSALLARNTLTDQARLLTLVARSRADAVALRTGDSVEAAEGARIQHDRAQTTLPNAGELLDASLVEVDIVMCRLADAHSRVEGRLVVDNPNADAGQWRYLDGRLRLLEGDVNSAYGSQLSALRILEHSDPGFNAPVARVEAAHAAVVIGRPDTARAHLEAVPSSRASSPRVRMLAQHVEALSWSGTRSIDESTGRLVEVGDEATDTGDLLQAARSWHAAVRLGRPEGVVGRLTALAESTGAPLVELFADHAERLADAHIEDLEDVGYLFGRAGFGLFAAEALAQASALHREEGRPRRARRASAAAKEYLPANSGVRTPALTGLAEAPPLTSREREIALMASSGMSSREIADSLDLSVRTVDNHLGTVYAKVGVSGRSELSGVFSV